ncbi:ABC-type sugar transport system, ATPase component [Sphaerochaeta pleomorpha str. Grapes]|uniref:ABC-type sugar transport system, ATPase component n=1 Tax=Sphaerochaeta pleomorpha (strain ATCC BAA-1885 / DSM 22778 / Grapes) TaxID=158190 RepID=G8QTF6_SPHPG|nr:sugar ABC transporter ATP-binding protein [Sphaerochaeta pleomorpha]AEV30197.1 ABC-type sugar transport system, ATPase component [Sphaerochaeta pleomorpha str. Grapes]
MESEIVNTYFLEMININKTFPGARVLKDVNLKIRSGEVRALIGENGAGKSTLIKILGGIYSKDEGGEIRINGNVVEINNVHDAKNYGISIIHQEICLADNMTVADNLFMGDEISGKIACFLDDNEMIRQAQEILDELGLDIDARSKVGKLSLAKQQLVEICRAIHTDKKLVVMDEPTSSLTKTEIDQLFLQLEKMKKANIAIIYISHRMEEIFKVSDSITVLRDGNLVHTDVAENLDQDKIIAMMVGRELTEIYNPITNQARDEECLVVKNFKNKKLKDVSFSLRKGEILGFSGLVGAGRTELARAIFGIDKVDSGDIFLNGEKIQITNVWQAIGYGLAYVPESRRTEGLFLMHSIKFNATISILEKFINFIGLSKKKENMIVDDYINTLAIKMTSSDQQVKFLSGGNQQKVVITKWLATKPSILILDEPTRGIDIGAKVEIYQLINRLAQEGVSIILISSEIEEVINLCNRIIVMYEGRISGQLYNEDSHRISQEQVMRYASGGNNNAHK